MENFKKFRKCQKMWKILKKIGKFQKIWKIKKKTGHFRQIRKYVRYPDYANKGLSQNQYNSLKPNKVSIKTYT